MRRPPKPLLSPGAVRPIRWKLRVRPPCSPSWWGRGRACIRAHPSTCAPNQQRLTEGCDRGPALPQGLRSRAHGHHRPAAPSPPVAPRARSLTPWSPLTRRDELCRPDAPTAAYLNPCLNPCLRRGRGGRDVGASDVRRGRGHGRGCGRHPVRWAGRAGMTEQNKPAPRCNPRRYSAMPSRSRLSLRGRLGWRRRSCNGEGGTERGRGQRTASASAVWKRVGREGPASCPAAFEGLWAGLFEGKRGCWRFC